LQHVFYFFTKFYLSCIFVIYQDISSEKGELPIVRVPFYIQIRQYIIDNIQQKKWRPNDKIPSENELAEKFGVSRITVKKALDTLVEEGIIYRIQGRGSFVSEEKGSKTIIYQNKFLKNTSGLVACIVPRLNSKWISSVYRSPFK